MHAVRITPAIGAEVMEVLQLIWIMGIQSMTLGMPILQDELAKVEGQGSRKLWIFHLRRDQNLTLVKRSCGTDASQARQQLPELRNQSLRPTMSN